MHHQCSIGIHSIYISILLKHFLDRLKKLKKEKYKKSLFDLFHQNKHHTHIHIMPSIILNKITENHLKKGNLKKSQQ